MVLVVVDAMSYRVIAPKRFCCKHTLSWDGHTREYEYAIVIQCCPPDDIACSAQA
jgi:hypothetical protein